MIPVRNSEIAGSLRACLEDLDEIEAAANLDPSQRKAVARVRGTLGNLVAELDPEIGDTRA